MMGLRFLWFVPGIAVVLAAIWLWLELIGLPHLAWRYTYLPSFSGRMADRYFLSCEYWGPYGRWTEAAFEGTCPWFAWRTRHAFK